MSEQDTREKLEADIDREFKENYKGTPAERHYTRELIIGWLDRQAAITSAEWCWSNDALEEELTRKESEIAELTAEVEKQRQRANDAERGALSDEWYVARDRYEDDVAALTAERDEWRARAEQVQESYLDAKDSRDNLRAAIDAMGNGQFYAMYRAKCDECERLKRKLEKGGKHDDG